MVQMMFGVGAGGLGGGRQQVDRDGDGQISFDELFEAMKRDNPPGMREVYQTFIRQGQGGGGGVGNVNDGFGNGEMFNGVQGGAQQALCAEMVVVAAATSKATT